MNLKKRMYRNCHKIYMPPILMIEVVHTLQKFKLLNSSFLSQNWEKKKSQMKITMRMTSILLSFP